MKAVLLLCLLLLSLQAEAVTLKDKISSAEAARERVFRKDSFLQTFMRAEGMITEMQLGDQDDFDDVTPS
jgi:hypothetical protein